MHFWFSIVDAVEQKEEWRRAKCWISGQVQDAEVYKARGLMRRLPWEMKIWALTGADFSSHVGVIARILSVNWLSEQHLDTLALYLNFHISRGKDVGECWVVSGLLCPSSSPATLYGWGVPS